MTFFFGSLRLIICSLLHHRVNFEKDCNTLQVVGHYVQIPHLDSVCCLFLLFCFLKGLRAFSAVYASLRKNTVQAYFFLSKY